MKNAAILIVFTSLVFFFGWWISDEPLNPAAQRWLDDIPPRSDAYRYLMGMDSNPGTDPLVAGQRQINRPKPADYPFSFRPDTFPGLFDSELLCAYLSADCLLKQQQHPDAARLLLADYDFLLDRYQHFLSLGEFAENTARNNDPQHYPPYELLAAIARLQSLAWVMDSDSGPALAREIGQLQRLLGQSHNLLSKLTVARMLTEKIQLAALLMQQGKPVPVTHYRLSRKEKSLKKALAAEFRWATDLLESDWLFQQNTDMGIAEQLLYYVGLRTNITTNRAFHYYRHYAALSENPASVIVEDNYRLPPPTLSQRLRNPMGNTLLEKGTPPLETYLIRMAHLDAKLQLLSWFRHPDQSLTNPWPESAGVRMDPDSRELCFPTRYNSNEHRSCLPVLPTRSGT